MTVIAQAQAPNCPVDFMAPGFTRNAFAGYRTIRASGPLLWYRPGHCFLVTGYKDTVSVLRDPRFGAYDMFAIWRKLADKLGRDYSEVLDFVSFFPFRSEGRRHDQLRRALARGVATYAGGHPAIRARIDRKLADAVGNGGFDLAQQFARYLFFDVMCDLIGIDEDHRDEIRSIATETRILEATLPMSFRDRFAREIGEHLARLTLHVGKAIEHAPSDFIRGVYGELPPDEPDRLRATAALVTVILMMANDATGGCVTFSVLNLLSETGDDGRPLVAQSRWADITDDAVRFGSPVDILSRTPHEDVEIAGYPVRAGELVALSLICANHDPTEFGERADSVTVKPGRNTGIPFGAGVHVCVGNRLTRTIMSQIFDALARLPPMRLRGEPVYGTGKIVRTIESLPVEFT